MKKPQTLTDQLRCIVAKCEYSRYAIWRQTGIDQASLSRFVSGERTLSPENVDRLGQFLVDKGMGAFIHARMD